MSTAKICAICGDEIAGQKSISKYHRGKCARKGAYIRQKRKREEALKRAKRIRYSQP